VSAIQRQLDSKSSKLLTDMQGSTGTTAGTWCAAQGVCFVDCIAHSITIIGLFSSPVTGGQVLAFIDEIRTKTRIVKKGNSWR
jgi:hypothetical protein